MYIGFDSFAGAVTLQSVALPGDSQDASTPGILFETSTGLNNPSPFALDLGTVVFELVFENTTLGQGTSFGTRIVSPSCVWRSCCTE